ncbi:hypothetical protein CB1_056579086 [Camelus ferus]|nr:hypothetical protein CB1_056579086 [Camelus ferus]
MNSSLSRFTKWIGHSKAGGRESPTVDQGKGTENAPVTNCMRKDLWGLLVEVKQKRCLNRKLKVKTLNVNLTTRIPGRKEKMLHNKHVMVRVGGGWETFAGYLLKHDPCRMLQISRVDGKTSPIQSKSPTLKDMNPDNYLVVSANYKAKKEIK